MNAILELQNFAARGQAAQRAVDDVVASVKTKPRSCNPTRFLCRSEVREFLLAHARTARPFHKYTRVSAETLVAINEQVRALLIGRVQRLPSKGRTI